MGVIILQMTFSAAAGCWHNFVEGAFQDEKWSENSLKEVNLFAHLSLNECTYFKNRKMFTIGIRASKLF